MGDDIFTNILFVVFILIVLPIVGGIAVQGIFFTNMSPIIGIIWYIILAIVFWIATFSGVWYFIPSAIVLTGIIIAIIADWGIQTEWADVMYITFGG